jgi:hypothetical protein
MNSSTSLPDNIEFTTGFSLIILIACFLERFSWWTYSNLEAKPEKHADLLAKTCLWTFNTSLKYFIMFVIMTFKPLFFTLTLGGLGIAQYFVEKRIAQAAQNSQSQPIPKEESHC